MRKRWVIHVPEHIEKIAKLEKELEVPPPISTILVGRAIESFEAAKHFFRPSLERLHSPFLMLGMERAVKRISRALHKKESILIYGDYDVDGTTAVAMVYSFFHQIAPTTISYYVPDRLIEGYGVSQRAIEKAHTEGIKLIITLDCGIKAHEALFRAGELGIDVIVCDHHEVGEVLPLAYAILNPKQSHCPYPFKELSGCGIGFKLLQAFCQQCEIPSEMIYSYLDLVAVSTACDVVPLVDENRILVYYGIKQLEANPCLGLHALMMLEPFIHPITVSDIVFKIGPRINAAGRIGHASIAIRLLIEQSLKKAYTLAKIIEHQNVLRKELDSTITQEALSAIEDINTSGFKKCYILFNANWHKGIIGIVASRCIEQYYRPTVVLTVSDGKATGSARSIPGFNIYKALSTCGNFLNQYGGHAFAAGLTMPIENISVFQEKFENIVSTTIADDLLIPQQFIHAVIFFQWITPKFINILMQMAPFGIGNPMPVFATERVYAYRSRVIKEKHLKLELYQEGCSRLYEAIGFGLASYEPLVSRGKYFSIAYIIDYNYYLGNRSIQLVLKDIKEEN